MGFEKYRFKVEGHPSINTVQVTSSTLEGAILSAQQLLWRRVRATEGNGLSHAWQSPKNEVLELRA